MQTMLNDAQPEALANCHALLAPKRHLVPLARGQAQGNICNRRRLPLRATYACGLQHRPSVESLGE